MPSPLTSLTLQSISLQVGSPASTCHTYSTWGLKLAGVAKGFYCRGLGAIMLRASHALQGSAQLSLAMKTQKGVGRPTTTLENKG